MTTTLRVPQDLHLRDLRNKLRAIAQEVSYLRAHLEWNNPEQWKHLTDLEDAKRKLNRRLRKATDKLSKRAIRSFQNERTWS